MAVDLACQSDLASEWALVIHTMVTLIMGGDTHITDGDILVMAMEVIGRDTMMDTIMDTGMDIMPEEDITHLITQIILIQIQAMDLAMVAEVVMVKEEVIEVIKQQTKVAHAHYLIQLQGRLLELLR